MTVRVLSVATSPGRAPTRRRGRLADRAIGDHPRSPSRRTSHRRQGAAQASSSTSTSAARRDWLGAQRVAREIDLRASRPRRSAGGIGRGTRPAGQHASRVRAWSSRGRDGRRHRAAGRPAVGGESIAPASPGRRPARSAGRPCPRHRAGSRRSRRGRRTGTSRHRRVAWDRGRAGRPVRRAGSGSRPARRRPRATRAGRERRARSHRRRRWPERAAPRIVVVGYARARRSARPPRPPRPPASTPGDPVVPDPEQLDGRLLEAPRRGAPAGRARRSPERHEPADVRGEAVVELDVERSGQVGRRELGARRGRRRRGARGDRLLEPAGSSDAGGRGRPSTGGPARLIGAIDW